MNAIRFLLVMFLLLATTGIASAEFMRTVEVRYDARQYPDLAYERGGAQGHSGAYIQILVGIVGYADLEKIIIKAKHLETDFEVTLIENDKECVGAWPYPDEAEQWFSVSLKPEHTWMKGDWEITLNYKTPTEKGKEVKFVTVPRFNFPPEPTGIQISEYMGQPWIAWNSIGAPGTGPNAHIEYRLLKMSPPPASCAVESYAIRPERYPYEMWSGNRIAAPLPSYWEPGDLIRIENRVYDYIDGVSRYDRGVRFFFMR
jgi:hypothetical protein